MRINCGLTITELIVVLAIIAVLISLLLPSVFSMRERARETACKNNLRQMHIALTQLVETTKELPPKAAPGEFGGWMVALLPFMEQGNLKNSIPIGTRISESTDFDKPPALYICPVRQGMDEVSEGVWPAHYVLGTAGKRTGGSLYDAPINLGVPWGSSPEMHPSQVRNSVGPHHQGFYFIQSELHGVEYWVRGQNGYQKNHAELRIEREDRWPIHLAAHRLLTVPR